MLTLAQLVFRQDLAQGGGEASTPGGERERYIPRARLGAQPARLLPQREGLGGDERVSREALQDQAPGQRRILYSHESDLPHIARSRHGLHK